MLSMYWRRCSAIHHSAHCTNSSPTVIEVRLDYVWSVTGAQFGYIM